MIGDIVNQLANAHSTAKAMYDRTSSALASQTDLLDHLDALRKLGDMVEPEDVIDAATGLVSSGYFTPNQAATLLSDMPTSGGQALAGWIAQHAAVVQQSTQTLAQHNAVTRHEMGVSALRLLAGHGAAAEMASGSGSGLSAPSPATMPSASNALTSGVPSNAT